MSDRLKGLGATVLKVPSRDELPDLVARVARLWAEIHEVDRELALRSRASCPPWRFAVSTSSLLQAVGEALYGSRWQSDLARALDVNDRTVRRWVAGEDDLPTGVAADLRRLCETRRKAIADVISRLAG